jgi:hypothetical protein
VLTALAGVLGSGCVRKNFFQPDARLDASLPLPATADSVRGATAGRQYARHGGLYHALVGRHNRPTWAAPVSAPILRLPTARPGGLRPGKVGGGFNSTSLTLTPPSGPAYVLRTVDKDPIRATPTVLRGTFLVNVLRDNISATNPYGSLVVAPLAQAAGVPHATPRLVYVRPDDPAFQTDSLRLFRGQLAYLEEKAAVDIGTPAGSRGGTTSTTKAFEAVFASPTHRIDQAAMLRARLLDGWLGDWDRHEGQWNWGLSQPTPTGTVLLTPLPKDRDMVFYRLDDGVLGWLVGHVFLRHWVTFKPEFQNATALLSSGHYLDVRALNGLSRGQFRAIALAMQRQWPDTLIERALRRMPPAAFALEGPRLIKALQARRADLPALANGFYEHLARRPVVGGTVQAERVEVHRYRDSTVVAMSALGGSTPLYRRVFFPSETRVIRLEGLGGNDVFVVQEHDKQVRSAPRVHLYGGAGTDEIRGTARGVRFSQETVKPKRAYDLPPTE